MSQRFGATQIGMQAVVVVGGKTFNLYAPGVNLVNGMTYQVVYRVTNATDQEARWQAQFVDNGNTRADVVWSGQGKMDEATNALQTTEELRGKYNVPAGQAIDLWIAPHSYLAFVLTYRMGGTTDPTVVFALPAAPAAHSFSNVDPDDGVIPGVPVAMVP